MELTLVIFSGLPGTGKSALSSEVSRRLGLPILRIDDLVDAMPDAWKTYDISFWDSVISILLRLAGAQLAQGISVIIDSVFMGYDRHHAQEIALRSQARFRPVYTFVSDENVWEQRVSGRFEELGRIDEVATWERVQAQQEHFLAWQPGTALFIDSIRPLEQNLAEVLDYVSAKEVRLNPLPVVPFTRGKYHG